MFGREAELAGIERGLDAVARGPSGLVLEGDPGVGKTVLWRAGVASARQRGYSILTAAPSEPEAALSFAGLADLIDGVPRQTLDALPAGQRQALDHALDGGAVTSDVDVVDRGVLSRALLSVLRTMTLDGPVLVAIDDEQWLDRPSARVLAFALRRIRDEPLGVLLARRRTGEGVLWPELADTFGGAGLQRFEIAPLSVRELARMLVERLSRPISRAVATRIHEVSGGNALHALAIAEEMFRAGRAGLGDSDVPIPATLGEAIARRVRLLPDRTREPLLVVAAVSSPTLASLQAASGQFALTDLDSAVQADVVEITGDRVRFTHPLLASTVYSLAPPGQRRELHRVLAEFAGDDEERARHLALGAEAPERATAIFIEEAAGTAARRGAPEVAAELLEHAARLTPASAIEAKRSRIVAAAQQHKVAGDIVRARALLEDVLAEMPPGALRARALHDLARVRSDDLVTATALLEEALVEVGDHHRVGADIESLLAEVWSNRGDREAATAHGLAALQRAERSGDPGLIAGMLATRAIATFFAGQGIARDDLDRAIALEAQSFGAPTHGRASQVLGCCLLWSDQLDPARPLLEGCLARAADQGEDYDRVELVFHLAHLEWVAGRVPRACALTDEVYEQTARLGDAQGDSYALWLKAFVALRGGELVQARTHAEAAVEVAGALGDHFIVSFSGAILAATELWGNDALAAHERISALREGLVPGDTGFIGSLTLPFWTLDVEALVAQQRLDEARDVLAHLSDRSQRADNPNAQAIAARLAGMLAAVRGDGAGGLEAMEHALEAHERRPLPLEVGRTWLEKGTLERRLKRKGDAKRSLEQALAILEPIGPTMWAQRARDELGRIGLRRAAATDGLTAAQRRVAELVIAGKSNREIGAELFMSLRTVESHLTVVYRHHGVRTRGQLVAALHQPVSASDSTRPASDPARGAPPG